MQKKPSILSYSLLILVSFFWAVPLIWAVITTFRPSNMATSLSFQFAFTLDNLRFVLEGAPFLKYGLNTLIIVFGILGVQLVTITLGGYA
ncbi:MAG: carbohydrate ABC transporter permease, partial [Angelakisella sp.]